MARSVRVEMILDTLRAVRGAKDLSKSVGDLADNMTDADRAGTKAGRVIDDLGDQSADAARAAAKLDHEIGRLTGSLRELAIAEALTGDSMGKQMREQEGQLRRLTKNRKRLLGDLGPEMISAGAKIGTDLGTTMGTGMAAGLRGASTALGPVMIGVAIASAPVIGATVASAVIGGAGVGGVIGGLVLAARDDRVKAAGTILGLTLMEDLETRAQRSFVEPVLASITDVQRGFAGMGGDLDRIFANSAKFVEPLTKGALGFTQQVTGGIADLTDGAAPVIEALSYGLANLGDAVGDVFTDLSDNGVDAAVALRQSFQVVEGTIRSVGMAVNVLTESYGFLAKMGAFGRDAQQEYLRMEANAKIAAAGNRDAAASLTGVRDAGIGAAGVIRGVSDATLALTGPIGTAATAADAHARAMRGELGAMTELNNALRAQIDPAFALIDAQNRLKTAQDRSARAIRDHGRNSAEAKEATRNLALAALDLQGKASAVATSFDGKLTPAMLATFTAAGLTEGQVKAVEGQLGTARTAAEKFDGKYVAAVSVDGYPAAAGKLSALGKMQDALKRGAGIVGINKSLSKDNADFMKYATGGAVRGPGTRTSDSIPALLSNDEHVWTADEVSAVGGHGAMKRMRHAALRGELPGFALGGPVSWPFPTSAAMTRIPSQREAASKVIAAGPSGGRTSDWIVQAARALVGGVRVISKDRPGARTMSGNTSYHALGRAVDFEPSLKLARLWNQTYGSRTKELITPWRGLDLRNGRPHHYSAGLHAQHSGSNAHDHIAMLNGGMINEPVFGVGRSGKSYSFAENGRPERVLPAGRSAAGGGPVTIAPVIHINGANHSVNQIAHEVSRVLGRTAEIYSRMGS